MEYLKKAIKIIKTDGTVVSGLYGGFDPETNDLFIDFEPSSPSVIVPRASILDFQLSEEEELRLAL